MSASAASAAVPHAAVSSGAAAAVQMRASRRSNAVCPPPVVMTRSRCRSDRSRHAADASGYPASRVSAIVSAIAPAPPCAEARRPRSSRQACTSAAVSGGAISRSACAIPEIRRPTSL